MRQGAHSCKGPSTWAPGPARHGRTLGNRLTPSTSLTFQRATAERWKVTREHACVVPGGPSEASPGPGPCPAGDWVLVSSSFYLCSSLSPQQGKLHTVCQLHPQGSQEPNCQTLLPGTSLRVKRPFWVTQFSAPSRGPRLQRHSPILSESRALGLIPWAFLESLTASPEVPPQLLSSTRYFVGSNLRAGSTRRENLDFHSNVQCATLPARCWGSSSVGQGPWPLPRPSSVFGALYMWPPVSLTPTRGSPRRQRRGHSQRTGEKATAQRGLPGYTATKGERSDSSTYLSTKIHVFHL